MKIDISQFAGISPKVAVHLLPDQNTVTAQNARLDKGDLRAWREMLHEQDISNTSIKSLFKWLENSNEHWCVSANALNFVRSPLASDAYERVYFTGETQPRFLADDKKSAPFDFSTDFQKLGVAAPTAAITSATGYTAGGSTYRAYFYCYRNRYAEQGPPSPLKIITDYASGDVTLTGFTAPTAGYGIDGTNLAKVIIYRTNSSTSGNAEFQEVGSFYTSAVATWATHTFTDNVTDANLGVVCPSTNYYPPDSSLKGFVLLPSGVIAGYKNNEVHFSEPYLPHAWPTDYIINVEGNVVGLGVLPATLVVLTDGFPSVIVGYTPGSYTKEKYTSFYPCLSARGIVSTPLGVMFPSKEGLIVVDQNGPRNLTQEIMSEHDWSEFYPTTIHGHWYAGKYIGFYNGGADNQGGFIFDLENGIFSTIGKYCDAGHVSFGDGNFYVVRETGEGTSTYAIYEWAGDPFNYMLYLLRSKTFLHAWKANYAAAQVLIDQPFYDAWKADAEENYDGWEVNVDTIDDDLIGGDINEDDINDQCINGDNLMDISSISFSESVIFRYYVNGELVLSKVITGNAPFKLPIQRGKRIEFELEGFVPVQRVIIGSGMKDMVVEE